MAELFVLVREILWGRLPTDLPQQRIWGSESFLALPNSFCFSHNGPKQSSPCSEGIQAPADFSACEMAITVLQDEINILVSILAAAVQ